EVGLPAVADDERELRANIAQSVLIGSVDERFDQDLVSGPVNARNQIANLGHLLTSSSDEDLVSSGNSSSLAARVAACFENGANRFLDALNCRAGRRLRNAGEVDATSRGWLQITQFE